jgi:hypothetical protein
VKGDGATPRPGDRLIMVQFGLSDVDQKNEPLICADDVSLICADLRTEGCVNQRFLLLRKRTEPRPTDCVS